MRKNIFLLLFVIYSVAAVSQRSPTDVHPRALLVDPPPTPGNGENPGNQGTGNTSPNTDSPASPSSSTQSTSTTVTTSSTTTSSSSSTTSSKTDTSSSQSSSSTDLTSSSSTTKTDSTSLTSSSQSTPSTTPSPTPSSPQDTDTSAPSSTESPNGSTASSSSDSPSSSGHSSPATGAASSNDGDSTVPTGTIIGLSVAGGVAVLAFVAFLIWKLTRKRFHGLDDIDEAIKWPEVGREPSSNVGYATGPSTDALSRDISTTYSAPSRDYLPETNDPYAVPPLPNYNPNLPYRDDPNNVGYYDPYRGPSPAALYEGPVDGHESIPLDTLPNNARTRSPAPNVALDATGRGSPVPGAIGYQAQPMGQSTYGQGGAAPYRGY